MRVLERAAPGFAFGVLFGLLETAEVLFHQQTISLPHLTLLILYAVLTQSLFFSLLFQILPRKFTDAFRSHRGKVIIGFAILTAAIFVGFKAQFPSHGKSASADPTKPNILLISVDTLRRDRLGCYGYKRAHTPNIDALAKESVLFEDATSPIPLTGPAHITMLTGDYPITHGSGANGVRIRGAVKTVVEMLDRSGYRTAGFVSGWTLKDESVGLANRFGHYDDELGRYPFLPDVVFELVIPHLAAKYLSKFTGYELRQLEQPGQKTTRKALTWMMQSANQPFFALVHYFDPHGPHVNPSSNPARTPQPAFNYNQPQSVVAQMIRDPEQIRKAIEAYDDEIAYTDLQVGNLIREIDQRLPGKTIVIFTADHGESLTEHGFYFDHGEFLYETCVRVPLLIRFPDRAYANSKHAEEVRLIDVAPTILELAGVSSTTPVDGKSILQVLSGGERERDSFGSLREGLEAASHARYYIRSGGYKLIWNYDSRQPFYNKPQFEEFYDLKEDPNEERNLTGTLPNIQDELRRKLQAFVSRDTHMTTRPDENVIEQLKSLGYTD